MDKQDDISKAASELSKLGASKGGRARASALTTGEKSEIGRKAIEARWKKAKGADYRLPAKPGDQLEAAAQPYRELIPQMPYSMFRGKLRIGEITFQCHVLNDLRRVFTQREVVRLITGGVESGNLRPYLENIPLKNNKLVAGETIQFKIPQQPTLSKGYEATLLIEICEAYLEAKDRNVLKRNQLPLARQAEIITRACAKVGIIALVDEATGFQKYREKQALQLKLQAFIAEEMQEWARMFPEDFWLALARLEGIHYSPRSRPLRWGKYVMAFVYDAVDPDVGRQLRKINPDPHFLQNHHQWLKKFGRERVEQQVHKIIGMMQACDSMDEFRKKFDRVFKKLPIQSTFWDIAWGDAAS